jgi:hypothetical protein
MAPESTTRWPLLNERLPLAPPTTRARAAGAALGVASHRPGVPLRRPRERRGFSIGWRHQAAAQHDAETALATATAHNTHRAPDRRAPGHTRTHAWRGGSRTSNSCCAQLRSRRRSAPRRRSARRHRCEQGCRLDLLRAGALTATADRIASRLKTLETYLTTTPTGRRILATLRARPDISPGSWGSSRRPRGLGASIGSFDAALRKLMQAGALRLAEAAPNRTWLSRAELRSSGQRMRRALTTLGRRLRCSAAATASGGATPPTRGSSA